MLAFFRSLATSATAGTAALLTATLLATPATSFACGGFFCTTVPIDQAAEQIVFSQDGNEISAMVRILYTGEAEDFSWVVPVPSSPQISIGSDITFTELELRTRPQFQLTRDGQVCPKDQNPLPVESPQPDSGPTEEGDAGGVTIEQELVVGPFDATVVSSDNPDEMAMWLLDNGYQLTDRGGALIAPYVTAGMKFVALKLSSGQDSGAIRPLIMKYQSDKPMIPIRLTAIAANDDMGVLTWIVNQSRAIPENYEHVIPNYTRLNWFAGSLAGFASYQTLITEAMNETRSGQGFATDYAGLLDERIYSGLSQSQNVQAIIDSLASITGDAEYIEQSIFQSLAPATTLAFVQSVLPLPDGSNDTSLYLDRDRLANTYSSEQLSATRTAIAEYFSQTVLTAIRDGVALLPQDSYITRLYTTLSADEMGTDPTFNYNPDMPTQSHVRQAALNASCTDNVSEWTLTLGEGTRRNGEVVIRAIDQPIPFQAAPTAVDQEPAAYERQRTSAQAMPESLSIATSSTIDIAADGSVSGGHSMTVAGVDNDNGLLGAVGYWWILLAGFALWRRQITS